MTWAIACLSLSCHGSVFAADCNTNGVDDALDIAGATSVDCSDNGVPDECEPDCNTNGVADRCDITGGFSEDVNLNLIPDACEDVIVITSRVFSVYNRLPEDGPDDAFSREYSVFNKLVDDPVDGAIGREFSVLVPPLVLDIAVSPPGAGKTDPNSCTVDYDTNGGDVVDITAIATNGFDFSSWSDSGGGVLDDPMLACTTVTVNDNTTVTATFVPSATTTLTWTGHGDGISWSDPLNWCPPLVPDDVGGRSFRVVIDGAAAVVQLDISPNITRLELTNESQLLVNAATGSRMLFVSDVIINTGVIGVSDGLGLDIDADINQTPDGSIQIAGGSLAQFVNGTITRGFIEIDPGSGSLFDLLGTAVLDTVGIRDLVIPDNEVISMDGVAINVNSMFISATSNVTGIDATSDLTLRPLTGQQADLILGAEGLAFLGNLASNLTNSNGHRIIGAGSVLATSIDNAGVIEAGATALGGLTPETLLVQSVVNNSGLLRANNGFTLNLDAVVNQTSIGAIEVTSSGFAALTNDVTGNGTIRSVGQCTGAPRGCTPPPTLRIESNANIDAFLVQATDLGRIELAGDSRLNAASSIDIWGGILDAVSSNALGLNAGSMLLQSSSSGQGEVRFRGALVAQVSADLVVAQCVGATRGCTPPPPPILSLSDGANLNVGGDFDIQIDVQLAVTTSVPVVLVGDFRNASTAAALFDWTSGSIQCDSGATQSVEAAGNNLGVTTIGFDSNFAIGMLTLSTNTTLQVVDEFDNQLDGTNGCDEALYIDTLVIESGSVLETQGCPVYYLNLVNNGGSIMSLGSAVVNIPTADFDDDGDVDVDDYMFFHTCFESSSPAQKCLDRFDVDHNQILELRDYAHLQQVFGN